MKCSSRGPSSHPGDAIARAWHQAATMQSDSAGVDALWEPDVPPAKRTQRICHSSLQSSAISPCGCTQLNRHALMAGGAALRILINVLSGGKLGCTSTVIQCCWPLQHWEAATPPCAICRLCRRTVRRQTGVYQAGSPMLPTSTIPRR